jgi:hypothetical protein
MEWSTRVLIGALFCSLIIAAVFNARNTAPRIVSALPLKQSQVTAEAKITCHIQDQFSYCVYRNSLCIQNDELVIVDPTKLPGPVSHIANRLNPSPWHLPFGVPVSSFDGSVLDNRAPVPYRSFFSKARYADSIPSSAEILPGWTLAASFDATNYNIYHLVNKIHAAFYARLYEIEKMGDFLGGFNPAASLKNLLSTSSEGFDRAFMFRDYFSNWQLEFMKIALGVDTKIHRLGSFKSAAAPVCFEKAIVPGTMLYLSDGLLTSVLFREMTSSIKGIRVAENERNLITIFHRTDKRRILNMEQVEAEAKKIGGKSNLQVEMISWTAETSFETQARHMARTKIFITTHGSVLNHCMFMEPGAAVVIEVNPYQFLYPLDQQIILNRGVYYLRYEAPLNDTTAVGRAQGEDQFPGKSAKECFNDINCYEKRRDSNLLMDLDRFKELLVQAISLVK